MPTDAVPATTAVQATVAGPGATVSLTSAAEQVAVGETVEVTVSIEGARDLYGLELHLGFDPAVLEAVGATDGAAPVVLDGDMLAVGFTALNKIDNDAGTVDYAVSQMPPAKGVSGDGVLARVRFRAVAAGNVEVALKDVLLANSEADAIPASIAPASAPVMVR